MKSPPWKIFAFSHEIWLAESYAAIKCTFDQFLLSLEVESMTLALYCLSHRKAWLVIVQGSQEVSEDSLQLEK